MACPYFEPGERLPLASGSLGDLYTGRCRASGEIPDGRIIADRCNLGYARGHCASFPAKDAPDAVRFSVARHEGAVIRILYSMERDHRPFGNGALDYSSDLQAFEDAPSDALRGLAH